MTRQASPERGFTLIELMISLVMFSIAVAGVLSVAATLTSGYREQRQVIAAESAVRYPMSFIADAIRQASPGVPGGINLTDASGTVCSSGALTVTNSDALSDSLEVIYAAGAAVTSLRSSLSATGGTIEVADASQLAAGDAIVVTDTTQGHLVKIATIAGTTLQLGPMCTTGLNWTLDYPPGSLVVRAQHAVFSIGSVDGIPTLMFDPDGPNGEAAEEPLAEGVEDLQVAIAVDVDGDNAISELGATANDDEWIYNVSGDTLPATGTIRAVRVTLIARAATVVNGGVTPFALPAVEDRPRGAADGYRRRVLSATTEIRNMEMSP